MQKKHMIATGIGVFVLVLTTATASALITKHAFNDQAVTAQEIEPAASPQKHSALNKQTSPLPMPKEQPVQQRPACDDGNIAGTVLGGAAGGVIGSQIGDGNGQTAATIAGVAGGAILGREYIPTHNVTCR